MGLIQKVLKLWASFAAVLSFLLLVDHFDQSLLYKRRSKGEPLGNQEGKKKPENREPVQPTMNSLAQRLQSS